MKALIFLVLTASYLLNEVSYCQGGSIEISNVAVTWDNQGNQTAFTLSAPISSGYVAVGFNTVNTMIESQIVSCRSWASGSAIEQFYASGYSAPTVLSSTTRNVGISNANLASVGGSLSCSFVRSNSNPTTKYFDLNSNTSPYIVVAYGNLNAANEMTYHTSRGASSSPVDLSASVVTTTPTPITTTETPATTTEVPVTSTEAPATTTEVPVTTTEAPATTTMPVDTTTGPMTSTTPSISSTITTTEFISSTTEIPITTTDYQTSTSTILSTISSSTMNASTTSDMMTSTQKPNPISYFTDLLKNWWQKFLSWFGY